MIPVSNTLYARYAKARMDYDILENEKGFVFYRIAREECYIAEMFIDIEHRGTGEFRRLIDQIERAAKEHGCECLSANIHIKDRNHRTALMSALHVGFHIVSADQGILTIIKQLGAD